MLRQNRSVFVNWREYASGFGGERLWRRRGVVVLNLDVKMFRL